MKKDQFQTKYGLSDEEMATIESLLKTFNGRIVRITEPTPQDKSLK